MQYQKPAHLAEIVHTLCYCDVPDWYHKLMQPLQNQKILLGITGGIASYKSAILARRLIDAGADVRVVMTSGAQAFITPLTLQALTGNPVHTDLLDPAAEAAMGHIELARWADIILIAPATANVMARLCHGFADDLLTTLCLASDASILLAPAMNRLMWSNAATQANTKTLTDRGVTLFGPGEGAQACGETGAGRMLEPEHITELVIQFVNNETVSKIASPKGNPMPSAGQRNPAANQPSAYAEHHRSLAGLHIVITAGPTVEPIDPVRYITNRSSGKMGFALAAAAIKQHAQVTLIAGPVKLATPNNVTRIDVDTAKAMHAAALNAVHGADVFISVAAVADYRVEQIAEEKIKKNDDEMTLTLVRNPDILASIASIPEGPFCVGFAAETQNVEKFARGKLVKKNLDLIAANQVGQPDNPVFGSDTNTVDVYWHNGGHQHIAAAPKKQVAAELLDIIAERLANL